MSDDSPNDEQANAASAVASSSHHHHVSQYKYLTPTEIQELKDAEPRQEDGDFFHVVNGKRFVRRDKLQAKLVNNKIIVKDRTFSCFAHFREYCLVLARNWGFYLTSNAGFGLVCKRGGAHNGGGGDRVKCLPKKTADDVVHNDAMNAAINYMHMFPFGVPIYPHHGGGGGGGGGGGPPLPPPPAVPPLLAAGAAGAAAAQTFTTAPTPLAPYPAPGAPPPFLAPAAYPPPPTAAAAASAPAVNSINTNTEAAAPPPKKKRARKASYKVGCPFYIRTSPIMPKRMPPGSKKSSTNPHLPVKITSFCLEHCAECSPCIWEPTPSNMTMMKQHNNNSNNSHNDSSIQPPLVPLPATMPGQNEEYKYLSAHEINELKEAEPADEDYFVDNDDYGKEYLDRDKLTAAISKLFATGRTFACFEHLKEFALVAATNWGFHLNVKAKFSLVCARCDPEISKRNEAEKQRVPPERRRRRINIVKVGCPFIIKSSAIMPIPPPTDPNWRKSRFNCQVKITSCVFEHSAECAPGPASLLLARKNSGFYKRYKIDVPPDNVNGNGNAGGDDDSKKKKRKRAPGDDSDDDDDAENDNDDGGNDDGFAHAYADGNDDDDDDAAIARIVHAGAAAENNSNRHGQHPAAAAAATASSPRKQQAARRSTPKKRGRKKKKYSYEELRELCDPLLHVAANDEKKSTFLAGMFEQISTLMMED